MNYRPASRGEKSVANPSSQEIKDFIVNQCVLWNAQDKAGYTDLWKSFATKEIIFEDPVGTPPKVGWDQWSDMWDQFCPLRLKQRVELIFVRGNEAAIVFHHEMNTADGIAEFRDIEIWKFDDGVVSVRCWWDLPDSGSASDFLNEYAAQGGHAGH